MPHPSGRRDALRAALLGRFIHRARALLVGAALPSCVAAGASPPADSGACSAAPYVTCPASPPSWSAEVQAIIDDHCSPCHFPGGVETQIPYPLDYSTYAGVHANASAMVAAVASCTMPPSDAGSLTPAESLSLLEWLHCGAPDN
jgi:uncharacterized membrane protein